MQRDLTDHTGTRPITDLAKGRYLSRVARTSEDMAAAHRLRELAFHASGHDIDAFDARCCHILIEEQGSGALVCCFRMLPFSNGREIEGSYSAQFYDLSALGAFGGPMVELGRFCLHPNWHDPDILRMAWGAITRYVDENDTEMLFGCSSFKGMDASRYADVFALLKARHLAPRHWRPQVKAPDVVCFAQSLPDRRTDPRAGLRAMPSLLRTYLMMGGWVSDHAVVDPHMNTLHVFTGLEIKAIPMSRKRLLRAVAQSLDARPAAG